MPKAPKTPAKPSGKKPAPSTNNSLTIAGVMLMAEIRAMTQPARISRFGECATVSQRAFAEMGKLRRAIEADLKEGHDFTNTMRKLGIRDGTISNSSYAARVFDLVEAGHVTEKQYDTFSFADCVAIVRVMGPQSKARLTGPDIAVVLAQEPANFDQEFACIYEHGVTVGEKADADKKAADAAKVAADTLAQQQQQAPAPTPAPTPAPAEKPKAQTPPAEEINPAHAPDATAPQAAPAADTSAPPAPDNIIPGPGATTTGAAKPAASKLSQVLNLIDTMELLFAELSVEDARKACPRLVDLADTVMQYCAEPTAPGESAKPVNAKKKAA